MSTKKIDQKLILLLTTVFISNQIPLLAQNSQSKPVTSPKNKTHHSSSAKSKTTAKADDTIYKGKVPVFQRRRGRLSAEEAKVAGEDANKFYRIAQQKEKAGKLDEAKSFYYKAAVTRADVWGPDSAVANIAIKLGKIEVKQKHTDAARHWFKQALKAQSTRFGSGDYELVPALTLLAQLEANAKNHEASSSYYDHILRLEERKFGEDNAKTVPIRILYIEELIADKDIHEAEKVANRGVDIEKKARGAASPDLPKLQQLLSAAQAARTSNSSK